MHEHNASGAGPAVELRVGLHAGEPVRDGKDYHGEAVVVAKRLCDLAGGGPIFTSEPVASLVGSRGGFSFRSAGRLPLKGLPRGVVAVTVDWLAGKPLPGRRPVSGRGGAPAPRGDLPPAPRGPALVGRADELAVLEDEFERSASGGFGMSCSSEKPVSARHA